MLMVLLQEFAVSCRNATLILPPNVATTPVINARINTTNTPRIQQQSPLAQLPSLRNLTPQDIRAIFVDKGFEPDE
jgi:hypothetical protein